MRCFLINDEGLFDKWSKFLAQRDSVEWIHSEESQGARLYTTKPKADFSYPVSLVLLPHNDEGVTSVLLAIQRKLNPASYIHLDIARSTLLEREDPFILLPHELARPGGRIDFGSLPVLYEEWIYDVNVRAELMSALAVKEEAFEKSRVFGPDCVISEKEDLSWLHQHLGCQATDSHAGAIFSASRLLGTPLAALFLVGHKKMGTESLIVQALSKF